MPRKKKPERERYKGVARGEWLARWLNADNLEERAQRRRIVNLIAQLKNYLTALDAIQQIDDYEYSGGKYPDDIAEEIAHYLRRTYNPGVAPRYSPLNFGPCPRLAPFPVVNRTVTIGNMRAWEAFQSVCDLFDLGRLGNLLPCEWCKKWMFVKFPTGKKRQRVHKGECHRLWYNEKMCEYMMYKREDPNFDGTGFFSS